MTVDWRTISTETMHREEKRAKDWTRDTFHFGKIGREATKTSGNNDTMSQGLWEHRETSFRGSVTTHYRFRIQAEKRLRLALWSLSVTLNRTVSIEREKERCHTRSLSGKDLERFPGKMRTNKSFIQLEITSFWMPTMSQGLRWTKQTQPLCPGNLEFSHVGESAAGLNAKQLTRSYGEASVKLQLKWGRVCGTLVWIINADPEFSWQLC